MNKWINLQNYETTIKLMSIFIQNNAFMRYVMVNGMQTKLMQFKLKLVPRPHNVLAVETILPNIYKFLNIICSYNFSGYTKFNSAWRTKENKINYFARMVKLTITKTLSRNILYMFRWKCTHCSYIAMCVCCLQ